MDDAGSQRDRLHRTAGVAVVVLVALLVALTGGEDSGLHALFLVVLVHAAITVGSRWVLLESGLVVLVTAAPLVYQPGVTAGAVLEDVAEVAIWIGVALVVAQTRSRQRETSEQLRRNEQRYRSLFDQHPDAVQAWGHRGNLVRQNPVSAEMVGLTPDEFARRPWTDFVPDERREEIGENFRAALRGEPRSFETRIRRPDGHELPVGATYIPIVVDDEVAGVYGIMQDISPRRRAQSNLALFRRVVDQISDAVVISDPDTVRFVYANPAAAELYGVPLDEIVGATPSDLTPSLDGGRLRERIAELRGAAGEGIRAEFDLQRPDGSSVPVESVGQIVTAPDGRSVLVGVLRDVSGRRRAEEARRQLAAIVESADHAIIGAALDGTIEAWNPGAESLYGYPSEEVLGRDVGVLAPPGEHHHEEQRRILGRVAAGESLKTEVRRQHRDGRLIEVALTVSPIRDAAGDVVGVSALSTDIGPRKAAERALRESERRFRTLAERGQGVVYLLQLEPEPRFEFVNATVEEITGFLPSDFYADPMLPLARAHPEDRHVVRSTRDLGPADAGSVTARFRHREGHYVWLEDRYTPITDEHDRVVAVQGVMFDVSARQEADEALQAALEAEQESAERLRAVNEMQTTFLQAVSHELRTPLTSIAGYAQTLRGHWHDLPEERVTHMLDRLFRNAERLTEMLKDLLDVDRLSRGTVQLALAEVDIAEVCRHVVDQIELHDHPVRVDAERAVRVRADGPKVERIVENLVYNAGKHTPDGTPIWVRVELVPEGGMITVEDDGPGIPEELREVLFEPFRQGPKAATQPSPGTGIGLALVARFSALHGGRVWIEDAPNGGATFRVLLPHEPPDDVTADPGGTTTA